MSTVSVRPSEMRVAVRAYEHSLVWVPFEFEYTCPFRDATSYRLGRSLAEFNNDRSKLAFPPRGDLPHSAAEKNDNVTADEGFGEWSRW